MNPENQRPAQGKREATGTPSLEAALKEAADVIANDSKRFVEISVYMTPEWIHEKLTQIVGPISEALAVKAAQTGELLLKDATTILDLRSQLTAQSARLAEVEAATHAFDTQLMNALRTHSCAHGDIIAACENLSRRVDVEVPALRDRALAAEQKVKEVLAALPEVTANVAVASVFLSQNASGCGYTMNEASEAADAAFAKLNSLTYPSTAGKEERG